MLKAHGSSLAHTVKFNIYIIDYKDFNEINEHYIRRMPTPAPARSCIGVAKLPRGTDVEIECIAVVPKVSLLLLMHGPRSPEGGPCAPTLNSWGRAPWGRAWR